MSATVVKVEGLGKEYVIGGAEQSADTLIGGLLRGLAAPLRRFRQLAGQVAEEQRFWALDDVSFEVAAGEVVGIIGRNGAGKSTLLKILSRVTTPTRGRVEITGRVASLLEVGTGFHHDLTGRENIYLNGAILGMSRAEIARRFDEIVAFAEIEKFIDTPVKRYSSGMQVRLAFAVAAHLESEILIVDEVLAVGDAAFQKKCLGKMENFSGQGRTILFVSHFMPTIMSLCSRAILLDRGKVKQIGRTADVVSSYYRIGEDTEHPLSEGDRYARLLSVSVRDEMDQVISTIDIDRPCKIVMRYRLLADANKKFVPNIHVFTAEGVCAFVSADGNAKRLTAGEYLVECHIPANFLNDGTYFIDVALSSFESGVQVHFHERNALMLNVRDPIDGIATRSGYHGPMPGTVRPSLVWNHAAADPVLALPVPRSAG